MQTNKLVVLNVTDVYDFCNLAGQYGYAASFDMIDAGILKSNYSLDYKDSLYSLVGILTLNGYKVLTEKQYYEKKLQDLKGTSEYKNGYKIQMNAAAEYQAIIDKL